MANEKTGLTEIERAFLLVPIVTELGLEAAKRFIGAKTLSDEELIAKAEAFNADTNRRNEEFAEKLAADELEKAGEQV